MVDDVFRDSGKHPQSCEADYQPEREVQPQILAAREARGACDEARAISLEPAPPEHEPHDQGDEEGPDRKSTRLNSSHSQISYAVFCLKKKKKTKEIQPQSNIAGRHPIEKKKHTDTEAALPMCTAVT